MKKLFILFAFISSFSLLVTPAFAQLGPTPLKGSGCLVGAAKEVATLDCVPIIIGNVVFWLLFFAGIVALVLIIISGFKFVTSGGEPKKAEGARKTLTWAIIGLFVILLSFAIVGFIARTTGVGCITKFGFTQCVPEEIAHECSNTHPGGYCPDGASCRRNDAGSHMVCQYPCGRSHPRGYCDGGKECLPRKDRPGDPACQFRCSDAKHNGWCPEGKSCKKITRPDLTSFWDCRN